MKVKVDAKITLMLREQDVSLFLRAMQLYKPQNDEEVRNRTYLLDVLQYLAPGSNFSSSFPANSLQKIYFVGEGREVT